jgi:hypothetical protein
MLCLSAIVSAGTISSNVAAYKTTWGEDPGWGYPPPNVVDDMRYTFQHGDDGATPDDWNVDLGMEYDLSAVTISARYYDGLDFSSRINGATVNFYNGSGGVMGTMVLSGFAYTDPRTLTFNNGGSGWSNVQRIEVIRNDGEYLNFAELQAWAEVEKYPTFIAGVTATATSTYDFSAWGGDVDPMQLVNNNSMSDQSGVVGSPSALSKATLTAHWHSDGTDPNPAVTFDLGGSYDLARMLVWNINPASDAEKLRGFNEVTIEYSDNGTDWTLLDDRNDGEDGNYTIPVTPSGEWGDNPYQANVDLTGITASHVRITALSNHGTEPYFGLSEVRFYVPEPSTCALLALGLLALALYGWQTKK